MNIATSWSFISVVSVWYGAHCRVMKMTADPRLSIVIAEPFALKYC